MATWDHERHRKNCDALRVATAGETADARAKGDFRKEIYDEARFLHMVLVQFAGTVGMNQWNTAIADARKQLAEARAHTSKFIAEARESLIREGLASTVNSESPDAPQGPEAKE